MKFLYANKYAALIIFIAATALIEWSLAVMLRPRSDMFWPLAFGSPILLLVFFNLVLGSWSFLKRPHWLQWRDHPFVRPAIHIAVFLAICIPIVFIFSGGGQPSGIQAAIGLVAMVVIPSYGIWVAVNLIWFYFAGFRKSMLLANSESTSPLKLPIQYVGFSFPAGGGVAFSANGCARIVTNAGVEDVNASDINEVQTNGRQTIVWIGSRKKQFFSKNAEYNAKRIIKIADESW